ncbi:MAG: DUF1854 domain-containing protein [Ruminococcaceae bacterium]|nr:DUF1854 domain-containing protein [Oscillospiraceae bacterium]
MNETQAKDELLDDGLVLIEKRKSLSLTPENAVFFPSEGGLISLRLTNEKGEIESFERVAIFRAFPITSPEEFLSVREVSPIKNEKGDEIGMIRHLSDFDEATQKLFLEELDRRYFTPIIQKITAVKEKFGYSYWDCETSAGHIVFVLNNPFSNIRAMLDGSVYINDIDGNCFTVPDPSILDPASYKKIEIYL